ncbi:MAG: adenosylmethionine decarboxylase [Bacteroidetes bacterium]|nr:MAG: adenosylmethionine decarboxylase [Bacteroidota bacterium]
MRALGRHLLLELYDADPVRLDDQATIEAAMLGAAAAAGATVRQATFHQFAPQGVSGVVIIEESHLTIHTWPELGYAAIDVFTCGPADPQAAASFLKEALGARRSQYQLLDRGRDLTG